MAQTAPAADLDVIAIGNAIVDVLARSDDGFLAAQGLAKGGMTLVDEARAEALYAAMGPGIECSGGSAANSMVGVAALGGQAGFIGRVRDDALGRIFAHDIKAAGVAFQGRPAAAGPATARCLILVTPDAQRTMATCLGISGALEPDDVNPARIQAARITYLEGYLFDREPAKAAFVAAAAAARGAGRRVALSLSDPFCVERHRADFLRLIQGGVDILLANEAEIVSLFQAGSFREAQGALGGQVALAALTRGAKGALILDGGKAHEIKAEPVPRVVDTTGAGDLFAAGFLHGAAQGQPPAVCGVLGAICAAEIIGHYGARPEKSLADLVRQRLG